MIARFFAATVLSIATVAGAASAQDYPTRPITMVIPFAAGGPTDVLGRVMAERMSQTLGQQVIVENVGGAGGMTGSQRVAKAQPDGYSFLLGTVGTHAQNQTLYARPLYDAEKDFMPVALIAEVPLILVTRKDFPANTLPEFVAHVKANQDKLNFASAGNGSAVHLGCLLLNAAMGTKVQHIPYRGSAPAMTDLQGGRTDFMCEIVSTALPQIEGGTIKAVATLTKTRSPVLKDLPTADESGLKGFEAYTWNAFFLPKGTPAPIAKKLHDATVEAMGNEAVKKRLEGLGAMLVSADRTSPEYLSTFIASEVKKWAEPIKASGISIQ
ncbi:Bug family tripartite tricarboxylate transporter substrate binding protein [Enterovirga rhinocerotis]|uniref:Tripartite-type tricarboxylate transporter receptor subunit TctC n=1 Tax=Enterovirga rhinocerotis TaxID=1339210 RepID=A0A4R7C7C0_9HYPH|nr:tripartite tricarboxylate transporter substrate-binding protein [Enterovirga rhinocerotis]TDR94530.1 tripartite-type tricarboxylate transporter receptor subunit TctC [Enterovirga rhinocerotis]